MPWPRRAGVWALLAAALTGGLYGVSQALSQGGPSPPPEASAKESVRAFIQTRPQRFGIYFQDLVSGERWGIDEHRPIPAASTVKVPIALYVNELVARGQLSWSDRVRYDRSRHHATGAGVLQYEGIDGATYSLRVLTNLLITISDNVAWRMLESFLGREQIADFMRRLGGRTVYPEGRNVSTAYDMGVYMAAVLDFARRHPEHGERLLDDLSHTIWDAGLPGQLPAGVRVAHKEGTIQGVADDVGVVFARRPYILAVLSEGVEDVDQGFADIARISRIVYDHQQRRAGP